MSGRATWVEGSAFLKRYPSAPATELAFHRTLAARTAGVPSPAVRGREGPVVLVFDRIVAIGTPGLAEMLQALACLHRMPPDGLGRFDPFLRIRPRLDRAAPPIRALVEVLQQRDAALGWGVRSPIHGDFHPGQTLRDANGTVWLIDLDDMALAPPEADLGNLAAWIATQAPGDLGARMQDAIRRVLAVSKGANPTWITHFCHIALVRRALKLAERGQSWVADQLSMPGDVMLPDPVAKRVAADAEQGGSAGDVAARGGKRL